MPSKELKRIKAVEKELLVVAKREEKLCQTAQKAKAPSWKAAMEEKVPYKVYAGLESAFCKGFSLVFHQGKVIIEKGYSKEAIQDDYCVRDYAVQVKGRRKDLKNMQQAARKSNLLNMTLTTVEGIGLGVLGIGLPDIVLFIGTLLKGIYETALNYGFDYESRWEQFLILKMMQASLSNGENWLQRNTEVEEMLGSEAVDISDDLFKQQIKDTASVFAMDMLLLKFIQGLPVVGVIGGAANPVYYNKVMKYVQLKYRKRYLWQKRHDPGDRDNVQKG